MSIFLPRMQKDSFEVYLEKAEMGLLAWRANFLDFLEGQVSDLYDGDIRDLLRGSEFHARQPSGLSPPSRPESGSKALTWIWSQLLRKVRPSSRRGHALASPAQQQ